MPSTAYRCFPPEAFTVSGKVLGFGDQYAIEWVRPGINLGPCSTSFLLTDESGSFYLTQSAHCVFAEGTSFEDSADFCEAKYAELGSEHAIEGYAAKARLAWVSGPHMQQYGASPEECGSWDLAILEVPKTLHAKTHPAIRHIGGPTALQDPLPLRHADRVVGYGNSDDRGFLIEALTGSDHGNAPVWPYANVFRGYFVGLLFDDSACRLSSCAWPTNPYGEGFAVWLRYEVPKITGDSGSSDLTGSGGALGVTSAILPYALYASGSPTNGSVDARLTAVQIRTSLLYDSLLRIWIDTGNHYRLVTWPEWSPDTLET